MSAALPLSSADRRLRNLSVAGLLIIGLMATVIFYLAWWQPWRAAHERVTQLAERQARAQVLLAEGSAVSAALAQAEIAVRQQPLWLPMADRAQAIDAIAGQIDQAVAVVGDNGQRCKVQSRNPVEEATTGRLGRVALSIRLRCGNGEWLRLAHILESGQPPLVLDDIAISAPPQYPGAMLGTEAGVLDISFKVSAFLPPGAPIVVGSSP